MAAISKTQIANLALSHIRDEARIANVDTESTPQALTAALWFDPARRQCLADYAWPFATIRVTLAAHSVDPSSDWAYRYLLPADCVQARYIENPLGRQQPPIPFEIEQVSDGTLSLLTNQSEAVLVYTKDTMDTALFSPYFVLTLSHLLAFYLAGPITGKKTIRDQAVKDYEYNGAKGSAIEANATAVATEGQPEAPWISGR